MSDNQLKIKNQTIHPTLTLQHLKKQLIHKPKKQPHLTHEQIPQKLQNFQMHSHQMHHFFDQFNDNH
ncbi:RNA polymerase sigma factor region1.1 domain-containing protein, partial [Staphylococcus epidermidis]|uniref:RNA polymerase sigma factor region1.1 domain-containing protein n=1 Tax=Staphylococcus epidermidis TaxID=1282 RepID=UPI0028CB7C07